MSPSPYSSPGTAIGVVDGDVFARVAWGLEDYVSRLMRGALWAVVLFAPLETVLALSAGGGVMALAVGSGLAAAAVLGIRSSPWLMPWLRRNPWSLVVLAAAVATLLVAFEAGPLAGRFGSLIYLPIALAALAGLPGYAVAAALVATTSEVVIAGVYSDEGLADLVVDERWLLNAALPLMLALALSVPVWFLMRFWRSLPQVLAEVEPEVADPPPPIELAAGATPWELLSPAEQRVVERLPEAAPKQIAAMLGLSLATVRTHLQHARRAVGSRNQAELAAWAAQHRPGTPA